MWFFAPAKACTRFRCAVPVRYVLADGDRADEGNRPDVRVGEEGIDLLAAAMDHLQHALRRAGLEEQLGEAVGCQRILFGGLEDEGVAAGDGQRNIHSGIIAGKLNG